MTRAFEHHAHLPAAAPVGSPTQPFPAADRAALDFAAAGRRAGGRPAEAFAEADRAAIEFAVAPPVDEDVRPAPQARVQLGAVVGEITDVPRRRPGVVRRRLRGLDGLRALAVLAVVVFHLDFGLLPGGFLGVDVFFVISGFLITNLLATEILKTGSLDLRGFYLRRAKRLLPTVLALLAVVVLASVTFWHDQLATLRGGVLSSLGYVTNWWLIADHQSYFAATGRPPMLQHLWSLAIEEQYYLVWSLVVMAIAGLLLNRRGAAQHDLGRRLRIVVLVALGLAVLSTVLMAVFAVLSNLPYNSTSRVYFGSDTHTMGLFLGSAAGAWIALRARGSSVVVSRYKPTYVNATDVVGLVALGVLIYEFCTLGDYEVWLYRGGFLFVDAVALVVVLCATRRRSLLGRVLDIRPVQWIGQRSYAIYIWHWPVVVVTRPGLDVSGPTWLINLLRIALIIGLATLSYEFIEKPLRSGTFLARIREGRRTFRPSEKAAGVVSVVAVAVLMLTATHEQSVVAPSVPAPRATVLPPAAPPTSAPRPEPTVSLARPAGSTPSGGRSSSHHHAVVPPPGKPSISAFGDSVLLGAGPALDDRSKAFYLDAVEGRQADDVLDDVARDASEHRLYGDVVIHVGNNGLISPSQLGDTLHDLASANRVLLVNDRVDRDWQDVNNHTISSVAKHFPNVRVLDWYHLSAGRSSWLYSDGLHLTPDGRVAYAQLVIHALDAP